MEKILTEEEQKEGENVQDLLKVMSDQEKELFHAYLKGTEFGMSLKENK
jgi:hypothetical protein